MKKLFENWRRFLGESITINGVPINVEISSDPESIAKGLMHRKQLDSDSGMLFCFPDQQERSFWMKNTNIPLSVAYANNDGNILNIEDMIPHSEEGIRSQGPASFALEMNKGWFDKNNVVAGDRLGGLSLLKKKLATSY